MTGNNRTSLLVWNVITSIFEQVVLVVVVLWGLPQIGVNIPIWGLVLTMVAVAAYAVFSYRKAVRALMRKPIPGLPDMVGTEGKLVSPLAPSGLVKIRGELWTAEAESGEMSPGQKVVVVMQDGLRLVVRENDDVEADRAT